STTPTDALGKSFGPLHDLPDQAKIAESVCAFSKTVTDPEQLPTLIEQAFNIFTSSRPRPVHIAIPMDVLAQPCQPLARKRLVVTKPTASPSEIVRAAELINSAQNPVVIAGGGCVNAVQKLLHLLRHSMHRSTDWQRQRRDAVISRVVRRQLSRVWSRATRYRGSRCRRRGRHRTLRHRSL
ncbi:MAG: hypothetical protein EBQ54_00500, partial [Actinobacteria bacterium]|nr:hypothetical protein [Actinomycetota bacterium]